jgi:DNA-binding transcriptional ArsR family regulator
MSPGRTNTIGATVAKILYVWHIVRFRERWEMSGEYERKMGLEYLRLFIAAGGQKSTESTQFLAQLAELRHYYPDDYYHLRGILDELSALAGTMERRYRGFLLNARLQAATVSELAARLGLSRQQMAKALKALERVGLVERIPIPQFPEELPEKAPEDAPKDKDAQSKGRSNRGAGKGRPRAKKPGKSGRKCASSDNSEMFPNPPEALYEMTNGLNQARTLIGQSAKGKKANAAHKSQGQGQGQEEEPPTTPPATPPQEGQGPGPLRPQDVTAQADRHYSPEGHREPATPPARVYLGPKVIPLHRDGDAHAIGDLLPRAMDGLAHGQAVRAEDFAREIFHLLGPPFDAASRDGARNIGCFRHGWLDAIDAGLSPPQLEELWAKSTKDAAAIGQHRKRFYRGDGNPENYWRFRFNKHLDSRRGLRTPTVKAGAG